MKNIMSRVHLTYGIFISLLCCTFTKGQTAPNVTGFAGETTLFTCLCPTMIPGGSYILFKDSVPFYDATSNGRIIYGKYNATAGNGEIKLLILNTNISDAGTYTCSHNFVETSGYVSVKSRPVDITTAVKKLNNGWQLTATATKVFPNDSTISSVICLKPDNASFPFSPSSQYANPNSDIPYLCDIYWDGTITGHLSGQAQCAFTLVTIETIVKTIVVSFPEPDSTSAPVPVQGHIVGVVVGICSSGIGLVIVVVIVKFCRYKKAEPFSRQETYSQPEKSGDKQNDDKSNLSVSQVNMDIMSTEKSDLLTKNCLDRKSLFIWNSRTDTCGTMIGTRPPQTNVQDGYQLKGQSIKTSLPPIVGPDINHHYGDPNKTTAGQQRAVTNEHIITTRHLIDTSQESRQATDMDNKKQEEKGERD